MSTPENVRALAERSTGFRVIPKESGLNWEDVDHACLVDIAASLRNIDASLRSLGGDGIHTLIQLAYREHRSRDVERREKLRAKKRATRERNRLAKLRGTK